MAGAFGNTKYYKILQVDRSAHPEILRAAYRTLLRVLGKHPDLGGRDSVAKNIIEAYRTLSDPERRRAYDQWLAAHSGTSEAVAQARSDVTSWIRLVLPEYNLALHAPFARSFSLVLERPTFFAPRLYVKTFSLITPANWPTIAVLCRAVTIARSGLMPSTDVMLITAKEIRGLSVLLDATKRLSSRWSWNSVGIGVCTFSPPCLHTASRFLIPNALRRLRSAFALKGRDDLAEYVEVD